MIKQQELGDRTQLESAPNLSLLDLPAPQVAGQLRQVLGTKNYQKNKKVRSSALAIADN
ncbi:hypothetical protein [Microcoleus sp.]|uniref:hypothetical protein n=1 Tax=Microcoleus sp. TaxID=44472 RepID=UPI00403E4D7C